MLSKEEHENILSKLSEMGNLGEDGMAMIQNLKEAFAEMEGRVEKVADLESNLTKVTAERDESRRAYRERFFSATPNDDEREEEKEETIKGIDELLGVKR